ncbi:MULTISPECIES: hypothetical protein [Streptomyces]|uniref:Uncharacterized protein n=1 Tax=Streptomyces melanosporofaciens TaxID=67327 RepID=A0A1H4XAS7_STRMJ|nr:hypothetical protein [Streptomyces melanosporofaciens]SED01931.1 hypothetical protein SAMN04490356_6524 [Streptomyces melanosporofaciens]
MYAESDWLDFAGEEDELGMPRGEWSVDDEFVAEDTVDIVDGLRSALCDLDAGATDEQLEEALFDMFGSMSSAEAVNLAKAIRQIERGASRALSDPMVAQIAATALPVTGSAVGTLVGGPAGTAVGGALGSAAGRALSTGRQPTAGARAIPVVPATAVPTPVALPVRPVPSPLSSGSTAATQGLVLSQHPEVLQALLAVALGDRGRRSINGVPVGAILSTLSSVLGQAAADADEMSYTINGSQEGITSNDGEWSTDSVVPAERAASLYSALIGDQNGDIDLMAGTT